MAVNFAIDFLRSSILLNCAPTTGRSLKWEFVRMGGLPITVFVVLLKLESSCKGYTHLGF
jgi:hypothetical protein